MSESFVIGTSEKNPVCFDLSTANRHGLITGASGTGKTITMKVLAEDFSRAGVPVFVCDMKGDVSGLAQPGEHTASLDKRLQKSGQQLQLEGFPCVFWDVFGKNGHSLQITVSDLGPDLLSRLLQLSPAQDGLLHILFQIADDKGLILDDLKDLKAMLDLMADERVDFSGQYGNISVQSLNALRRSITTLEQQGAADLFGLPALDIQDLMVRDLQSGKGNVNILDCTVLSTQPRLYAAFLIWLLSELYETMPEAGDLDRPKLAVFLDEAHLIFDDCPKAICEKIEQIIRLIRSKGVGVYFISQNPSDIPDGILSQLSNRIQHALRAYTPADQKALKAAARSLRANPDFDTEETISDLGIGQALVSLLDDQGVPGIVRITDIACPASHIGPCEASLRSKMMASDRMGSYDQRIDPVSAYEMLMEQKQKQQQEEALAKEQEEAARRQAEEAAKMAKEEEARRKKQEKEAEAARKKAEKEAEAAMRKAQREAEAAARKAEREAEAARKKEERARERRKAQIERQLIATGSSLLRRTLLNTLKKR